MHNREVTTHKVYEVQVPYPQILVYFVEATSEKQAIKIATTSGVVENYSLGGNLEEIKVILRDYFKPSKKE